MNTKTYRKPSGAIVVLQDGTPVSNLFVQIAAQPSSIHTVADAWATDPMNPSVCWRIKTQAEQDAEKNNELQAFLDSAGGKALKSVALVGIDKNLWTLAELKAKYRIL